MPLPRTWEVIRSLARLSRAEERCLRLRCFGWGHADIAEALSIERPRVADHIALGQVKCWRSRPWLRRPRPHEVRRDVLDYWREARALESAGIGHELEAFAVTERCVDDDLVADARVVLGVLRNSEMVKGAPASGPRLPGPWRVTAEWLAHVWLECLVGGDAAEEDRTQRKDRSNRIGLAGWVVEGMWRSHAEP